MQNENEYVQIKLSAAVVRNCTRLAWVWRMKGRRSACTKTLSLSASSPFYWETKSKRTCDFLANLPPDSFASVKKKNSLYLAEDQETKSWVLKLSSNTKKFAGYVKASGSRSHLYSVSYSVASALGGVTNTKKEQNANPKQSVTQLGTCLFQS